MKKDEYHILKLHPFLDHKNKFMAFLNTRCASTSIYSTLGTRVFRLRTQGCYKYLLKLLNTDIKNTFSFTIVRNPWDRAISAFFFLKDHDRQFIKDITFKDFVINKLPSYDLTQEKKETKENRIIIQEHFRYQYMRCGCVNFIGKLETIKRDWEYISSKIGCEQKLKHLREGNHEKYKYYYDDTTKSAIADIYYKDIKTLNYNF